MSVGIPDMGVFVLVSCTGFLREWVCLEAIFRQNRLKFCTASKSTPFVRFECHCLSKESLRIFYSTIMWQENEARRRWKLKLRHSMLLSLREECAFWMYFCTWGSIITKYYTGSHAILNLSGFQVGHISISKWLAHRFSVRKRVMCDQFAIDGRHAAYCIECEINHCDRVSMSNPSQNVSLIDTE